jgi:membrane-associated phospholipid phosphatase
MSELTAPPLSALQRARPGPARRRELHAWAFSCAVVGLLFGLWPALDLSLAGLFFDPALGQGPAGFSAADQALVLAVYQGVPWLGRLGLLVGLLAWAWPVLARWPVPGAAARRTATALRVDGTQAAGDVVAPTIAVRSAPSTTARRWRRRLLMMLMLLVLGLGLTVNGLLKEGWGRPRPEQVGEFGGVKVFQPWWQPSRQCPGNCSFVTGHGATGAVLLGIGLLAAPARRRRWLAAGLLAALAIGLVRMLQGGHFASDVLGAVLVMWGLGIAIRRAALLWRWRRIARATRP